MAKYNTCVCGHSINDHYQGQGVCRGNMCSCVSYEEQADVSMDCHLNVQCKCGHSTLEHVAIRELGDNRPMQYQCMVIGCDCVEFKEAEGYVRVVDDIDKHEGKKYLTEIKNAKGDYSINVDVYCVLEAFKVTCPARQHAIKKLLTAGKRGKGTELEDVIGAHAAICRAVELQRIRENKNG